MEPNQRKPCNYLVFDGGYSVLSALYMTEEMFARLQYDIDPNEQLRVLVRDYCDLLSGTGSGAVAAILLGRMGLTPSQAINAYLKLDSALSVRPTKDEDERRRNTDAFKKAFTAVLEEAGFTADTPMLDKTAPKTVVWTLNAANLSVIQPIRSYRTRSAPGPPFTILEAAFACVASPDKFLPAIIGTTDTQVVLVDAMMGYANPTKEFLWEAQRVFGQDAEVASIISLGAGKREVLSVGDAREEGALMDSMAKTALDSEQRHREVHGHLYQSSVYFRLNVDRGLVGHMSASSIRAHTSAYMQEGDNDNLLNDVVESIKSRQKRSTLKDINSVTTIKIKMKPRPSLVRNFVGREDILEAMRQTHLDNRSPDPGLPAITVLMGLGGSGKTQTALKFVLEYEGRYRDASVYFFNASSEAKLQADFELSIRARDSTSHSKSHSDALVWFADRNDNWFIIMDNADDPSVELFRFIPKSSHGNVIITTRNAMYKTLAPNGSHYVGGLASSDAVKLILKGASYRDEEENIAHAQRIAEALGYLPLALAHAAGYISVHRCLSTYLEIFASSQAKFLASKPTLLQDYNSTVAATIQPSLDSIPQPAQDLMVLLSRFDVLSIARSIIVKSAKRQFRHVNGLGKDGVLDPQTTGQADELMAIFCPSGQWLESDFNDPVEQCLQYSLLQVTTQGEAKFYSMHILVQAYLQSRPTSINKYRSEQIFVRLLGSAVTYDTNYKYQAFNRLIYPHLRLVTIDYVVKAGDHLGFGQVLHEQGSVRLSTEHLERCVALRRSNLGNDSLDTAIAMGNLALSYRDLGRHRESLELGVKVLDLRKRLLGDDHPDTVIAMANLATSYGSLGRYMDAMELELEVLDLRKRLLGDEDVDTTMAMANLAASYGSLGRYKEAMELEVQVLDLRKRLLGNDHPSTVIAMANLALSYRDMGRHREALELGVEVLHLQKQLLGDDHPDTVTAMANLAASYSDLRRHWDALDLGTEVLHLRRQLLGNDHPDTVTAMANLAASYRDLARYKEALMLEEKVLEMRTQVLGQDHPHTLLSMWNISATLHKLGRKEQAITILQAAVPLQENAQGMDHPQTMGMQKYLAYFLKTSW